MFRYALAAILLVAPAVAQTNAPVQAGLVVNSLATSLTQKANGTMYVSTADATIASASELTCFGAGIGTQTVPASAVAVGTRFAIGCRGVYTTPAGNTATMTFKIKWGATAIVTVATAALPASQTNSQFVFEAACTVRAIGASGSVVCNGLSFYASTAIAAGAVFQPIVTTAPVTIDTTAASALDLTMTWSSVAGGQAATGQQAAIMVVN